MAGIELRELERKLGGRRLVDRTSRVVTPIDAGQALRDEIHGDTFVACVEQVVTSRQHV